MKNLICFFGKLNDRDAALNLASPITPSGMVGVLLMTSDALGSG
jgi:hypothetical protein